MIDKLAKKIVKLRRNLGVTKEKFAYENGISKGNYTDIENGKGNPTLDTLEKIAKGFGISLKELFDF